MENKNLTPYTNTNNAIELPEEDAEKLKEDLTKAAKNIINASTADDTKSAIDAFNVYMAKKNAIREIKLDSIYDNVIEQMYLMMKHRGGNLSTRDLLEFASTLETAMDKNSARIKQINDAPQVQLTQTNNNNVTVNIIDTLTHEQRDNIADALKAVLESAKNSAQIVEEEPAEETVVDTTFEEIKFKDDEDDEVNNNNAENNS